MIRYPLSVSKWQGSPRGRHVCNAVILPIPDDAKAQMRLGSLVQQIEYPPEEPSVARPPNRIGIQMIPGLRTHEIIPGMLYHHEHMFGRHTLLLACILTTSS